MRNNPFLKLLFLILFILVFTNSCNHDQGNRKTHELLNAVLWMQQAAEYKALNYQAYNSAKQMIDIALNDKNWSAALEQKGNYQNLPPAVILDVDETVLDNSAYESLLIRTETVYNKESWDRWCNEQRAAAIPGALEFCNYAREKGVTVFYITNRRDHLREATRQNLQKLNFPLDKNRETVLTRSDSGDKGARRELTASEYRILLLIGDNNGDFASGFTKNTTEKRSALTEQYSSYWGTKWIVLANPAYGDWESALFNYDYSLADSSLLRIKYNALIK